MSDRRLTRELQVKIERYWSDTKRFTLGADSVSLKRTLGHPNQTEPGHPERESHS